MRLWCIDLIILAISDIHERLGRVREVKIELDREKLRPDIVVIAGDITYFKDEKTASEILLKIRGLFDTRILFIPGNCDSPGLLGVENIDRDILNIHLRLHEVNGLGFYGIGGGGVSPFNTLIEYSEDEFREYISRLNNMFFKGRLILVTHQPVYGYFDDVDGENIGSRVFLEYLHLLKPLLWVTGHVHENSGWIRVNDTTIVHPGPLMKGYYAIVEIDDKNLTRVEVRNTRGFSQSLINYR